MQRAADLPLPCLELRPAGKLAGIPFRDTFVGLDPAEHGLKPVEHEIYHGFIFVRLAGDGPSVAEMMAPYEHEIAAYRMEELVPLGRVTLRPRAVNWKKIADNYSDSLHINVAHPGLTRLFGRGYGIEAREWVDKMWGYLREQPSANRSERMYQQYLPTVPHLPAGPAAAVDLFQALAQRRLRHLSRPDRLHAVPAADARPRR